MIRTWTIGGRVLKSESALLRATGRYCSTRSNDSYVYSDRTPESLQLEIDGIFDCGSTMSLSIGLLSASMLGNIELYVRCMAKLFARLGTEGLCEIDHNTWTSNEIAACSLECYTKLKDVKALDVRLWLLGRACMAAEFMQDVALSEGCRQVIIHALGDRDRDSFTPPEGWSLGYVLHHIAGRHANSEQQIDHSPGGNQKPKDAFGVMALKLSHISKTLQCQDPGDIIWCRIMLLHAVSASASKEHWSRYSWTLEYFDQLPITDYRAWALALIAHSAARLGQYDAAVRNINGAMDIIRTVPPSERAPHEDLITLLTLRTAFVDLHRLEPRRSKKLARACIPHLPFVVRGQMPRLLGDERHLFFKYRETKQVLIPQQGKDSILQLSST